MKIAGSSILITGAAGGIGSATARSLGSRGASLLLTDLRPEPLEQLQRDLVGQGVSATTLPADIGRMEDRQQLAAKAAELGVDTLINIAGINPFGLFEEQSETQIEAAIRINTIAPILVCRALLPVLLERDEAHIVNVGSVFGSLGYPGFAAYSASKFAVRGFTEALRRELADRSVHLHYVAPRATETALSTDRIRAMNEELGVGSDSPLVVAREITRALRESRRELYLGRSERLFGWLNSIVPGLVDRGLRRQLPIVKRFAAKEYSQPTEAAIDSIDMNTLGAR